MEAIFKGIKKSTRDCGNIHLFSGMLRVPHIPVDIVNSSTNAKGVWL